MYIEAGFEAASLTLGVASLKSNLEGGRFGAAAVDGIGLAVDGVLAALPIAPGVAGLAIQGVRQGGNAIQGTAQATRKGGELTTHGSTSERIAGEMAESGEFTSVHMNQTVSTITEGAVDSRVRPDVAGVRPDGTVDAVEVLSPGQTSQQMTDKLTDALGDRAGEIRCVDPDGC